jgi:hypothetical protein
MAEITIIAMKSEAGIEAKPGSRQRGLSNGQKGSVQKVTHPWCRAINAGIYVMWVKVIDGPRAMCRVISYGPFVLIKCVPPAWLVIGYFCCSCYANQVKLLQCLVKMKAEIPVMNVDVIMQEGHDGFFANPLNCIIVDDGKAKSLHPPIFASENQGGSERLGELGQ